MNNLYKQIPQVAKLLDDPNISSFLAEFFQQEIKNEIEHVLNNIRAKIGNKEITEVSYQNIVKEIVKRLKQKTKYSLRKVVNGTGTIVHTNLGRSLLSKQVLNHVLEVCSSYNNLEYDLIKGCRGSRYEHVEKLMANIVGSEACLIVNNNAAATLLCVATFAKEKEVIVSRGELVEIGGSFRIPEIIELSQAILKEVGTTNRTHFRDYENATTENTAMYLKVHPSNYMIQGFTKNVSNEEIVYLANKMNKNRTEKIITMEDLGSGMLINLSNLGLKEKTVQEAVQSGIDLVTFSGDKLLGGPQAGIIVGKKRLIEKIKKHPFVRALRVGKMTLAALEATLRFYYDENLAKETIPTLQMLYRDKDYLAQYANNLKDKINEINPHIISEVIEVMSTVGGGALPLSQLPSYGIKLQIKNYSTERIETILRNNTIPIIGRIYNNQYILDCRTLCEGDEEIIIVALKNIGEIFT